MELPDDWRRYVAPAAFLLAVTIAVVLIRSGLESGGSPQSAPSQPISATTTTTQRTTTSGTTTHSTTAAAKQFWTVKAGDTFGVISSQSGVPVAAIEQLNPTVKSTSLFIGEKIRVK